MPKEPKNMSYGLWASALKDVAPVDGALEKDEMTVALFADQFSKSKYTASHNLNDLYRNQLATRRKVRISGNLVYAYKLTKGGKKC